MKVRHYKDSDTLSELLKAYRLPTLIVAIGLIMAVAGFQMALQYDMAQSEEVFQDVSDQMYRTLDSEVKRHEQQISSLSRILGSVRGLQQSEFAEISSGLKRNMHFVHISLYSQTPDEPPREIFPADDPAERIENTADIREIAEAIKTAKKLGKTYISRPFEVPFRGGKILVSAITAPVQQEDEDMFLIGLVDVQSLFRGAFKADSTIVNVQISSGEQDNLKLIYEQYEDQGKEFFTALKTGRVGTLHFGKERFFDDYKWDIHVYSSIEGITTYVGLLPWITFAAILSVTGLLGYIVFRITVENIKARMLVDRQTESLRAYTEQLEASNRDLDDFAYIASHDLKEPLRGIYNYAEFLLEDYKDKLDEDGLSKLHTLRKLSRRMESLIDTLLEYSRISREDMAFKKTDINEIVRDVIDTMAIWIKENKATVTVQSDLPEVVCDRGRVSEIFSNLIANAVKYNNKTIKMVEIGYEYDQNGIPVFFVKDNGIGVPPEHQKSIFKIFKRLHGRDEYGGGTGSGLTIVQRIIDRHGGRIWLQSREHEGTTFYFTLSRSKKDAEKQA